MSTNDHTPAPKAHAPQRPLAPDTQAKHSAPASDVHTPQSAPAPEAQAPQGAPAPDAQAPAQPLATDARSGMLGLDPRTHLVALCAIGACSIVAIGIATTAALQAVAAVYLAANGHARLAARSCVGFCAIAALSLIPLPGLYGVLFVSLMHMTPPFTAGLTLFALSPSAIMGALARWRVPRKAMAAVCMAFRFAALLPQEARAIASGIRMRGVFARGIDAIVHPALAYECLYTPLVMRVLRLSSELAASAELRGIEANGRRTSLHHTGFEVRDALCSACVVALPVAILALEAMAS